MQIEVFVFAYGCLSSAIPKSISKHCNADDLKNLPHEEYWKRNVRNQCHQMSANVAGAVFPFSVC